MERSTLIVSVLILCLGIVLSGYLYFKKQTLENTCAIVKTSKKYNELICQTNGFKIFKNLDCKYVILVNGTPSCLNNYSILFYIKGVKGYVITKDFILVFENNGKSYLKTKKGIFNCKKVYDDIVECKKGKEILRLRIL